MRLAEGVYMLPIPRSPQDADSYLNLTLILDVDNGNTLVDASLPDQTEAIGAALLEAGIGVRDLSLRFNHEGFCDGLYVRRKTPRVRPLHELRQPF